MALLSIATSASNVDKGLVNVNITVDGFPVTVGVSSVIIHHELNQISYAELVLIGDDKNDSTLSTADNKNLDPGGKIIIKAGFDAATPTQLFSGIIVQNGVEFSKSGLLKIHLLCKHSIVLASYNRVEKEFHAQTDSAIMTSILSSYGGGIVTTTMLSYEVMLQKLMTDWDFIRARAEFNGYVIALDGSTTTIGDPCFLALPPMIIPSVMLSVSGGNVYSFYGKLSAENQPTSITASSWDIKTMKQIESSAVEPSMSSIGSSSYSPSNLSSKLSQKPLSLNSSTAMSSDDLKTWANGVLLRKRLSAFKGKVTCIGDIGRNIKTNSLINISGVGSKLDGNAYVTGVTHEIHDGKWETTAKFGLDERYTHEKIGFNYPVATGQTAAFHGLQIGTVKQLSKDPQSLYRVLVLLSTNSTIKTGFWARLANFYATNNAGLGFLPEVGDEVVVGFLEDDPRNPVILGSLYGKNVPPNPAKDENNFIKQIITKAKLKINFDDENKVLTLTTPEDNSITLDDKNKNVVLADQNKNTITLSSSGITISSEKDINLTAKGGINLKATTTINNSATQDFEATGMNISLTAKTGFTAKGNATAEVSASGQTTIKGGIVNIN
jgi:phage protein D